MLLKSEVGLVLDCIRFEVRELSSCIVSRISTCSPRLGRLAVRFLVLMLGMVPSFPHCRIFEYVLMRLQFYERLDWRQHLYRLLQRPRLYSPGRYYGVHVRRLLRRSYRSRMVI